MINYYKILGLKNYASVSDVVQAYKAKMKIYHPDINHSVDAEEIAKHLNIAKEQLETKEKKLRYDKKLKLAYLIEINRLNNKRIKESRTSRISIYERRKRQKENEEARLLKTKEEYEASLLKFPLNLRIIGLSVLCIWGLQLIYSNYFVSFGGNERLWITIGFLIYLVVFFVSVNQLYTHFLVKSINHTFKYNFERVISSLLFPALFTCLLLIFGLNNARKSYHLSHYSQVTEGKVLWRYSSNESTIVRFTVQNQTYLKEFHTPVFDVVEFGKDKTFVKYAMINPLICELVLIPGVAAPID